MASLPMWNVLAHYAFRPRLMPTLATFLLLPVLLSLGSWQLDKFHSKEALQKELDQRSRDIVIRLRPSMTDAEALRFRHVAVRGRFETERQILLDNRVYREQAGYHVLTPLRVEGSDRLVLINRGWVAATADHQHPPEVSTPQGIVELRGIAVVPSQRVFALAPETPGWHSVWQNLDLESWGDAVGDRPLPVVIQLDADSPAGFARDWPRPDERMEQNLSYAFQWRGFAIALVGFWLVASTRRRTR